MASEASIDIKERKQRLLQRYWWLVNIFQGKNSGKMGTIDQWGFFHVDPRRIRDYIVPNLEGFQLTPYVSHLTEKFAPGNRNTLSSLDFFDPLINDISPPDEALQTIQHKKPPKLFSKVMAKLAEEEKDTIYQGFKKDTTLLDTYFSPLDLEKAGITDQTLTRKPYKEKRLRK